MVVLLRERVFAIARPALSDELFTLMAFLLMMLNRLNTELPLRMLVV
jgi:hypothetical protein